MDFKYKTKFASESFRVVKAEDSIVKEAKANIQNLKDLLPSNIDLERDNDILYITGNLYVASLVNLNDSAIDCVTAVKTYSQFAKKQINIEHNRQEIVGYIVKAGLSEFGTDRLISEQEALDSGKPFNIAIVAAIWKVANPSLAEYLSEQSIPGSPDFGKLSFSFEVGFNSYDIAAVDPLTRCLCDKCTIVKEGSADFAEYDKLLRMNGGKGVKDDMIVGQVLSGDLTMLGGGLVSHPAASVKGVLALEPEDNDAEPDNDIDDIPAATIAPAATKEGEKILSIKVKNRDGTDATHKDSTPVDQSPYSDINKPIDNSAEIKRAKEIAKELETLLLLLDRYCGVSTPIGSQSQPAVTASQKSGVLDFTTTVNNITKNIMNIQEALASLKSATDMETVKASVNIIADAIKTANEKFTADLAAKATLVETLEKSKADAEKTASETKAEFDEVKKELDEIKAKQVALEKAAKFDSRIASIKEEYELDEAETSIVVAQIKDLDDAGFSTWAASAKVMMKEKCKKTKAEKKKMLEDKMEKAGVKVTIDESTLDFKEILAKVTETPGQHVHNTLHVTKETDLKSQYQSAFGDIISVGGKKLSDTTK